MTPKKIMYDKMGPAVAEKFKKRHFDAYYCPDKESAVKKVLELIPKDHIVAWGGSATMEELRIKEKLAENGYSVIDRDKAESPEQQEEISRKALLCDTFIMSANALSADGQVVNIDGTGNRVAAMVFGPKSVVVVAGLNKVAPNLEEAVSRARNVASPMNKQRFTDLKTPCDVTGMCADCVSPDCICAYLAIARISRPAGKIKVVLVGEDLGM